jgi:type VI secretion system protein ImpJ
MKQPRRPVWSEGMLLSPQHLQALDDYHETLLAARLEAVVPIDWGVASLEIDPAALAGGELRVLRFAGVLPDGLVLTFEEGDAEAVQARPVAEHFPPTARSLDVFLAVARARDGVPTFADESAAARVRFAYGSRSLEDATAPGQQVSVPMARPNALVLFGDESRDDHEVVKIAELARDGTGKAVLVDGYVPPALKIGASPWLVARVREVMTRLVAKQRELAEMRRQREAAAADMSPAEVSRLVQALVLNASVPVLSHLADSPATPPREAYLALARLAGQLSTFAPGEDPATLPRFDHGDLRATFEPLLARLGAMLGGMSAIQYQSVPLEQRAGGLHVARVQNEAVLRSALFLSVKSELPEAQVAEKVPRLCKIASAGEIQGLLQAASPGLALTWLPRPPAQLPARAGVTYFAVGTGDRFWPGILTTRTIAIYLPPPFEPTRTKVELLAVASLPPGGAAADPEGRDARRP